jgi:hypothetical protein
MGLFFSRKQTHENYLLGVRIMVFNTAFNNSSLISRQSDLLVGCAFDSRSWQGVLDTTLCDKFVSELQPVGGFLHFPPPIKVTSMI